MTAKESSWVAEHRARITAAKRPFTTAKPAQDFGKKQQDRRRLGAEISEKKGNGAPDSSSRHVVHGVQDCGAQKVAAKEGRSPSEQEARQEQGWSSLGVPRAETNAKKKGRANCEVQGPERSPSSGGKSQRKKVMNGESPEKNLKRDSDSANKKKRSKELRMPVIGKEEQRLVTRLVHPTGSIAGTARKQNLI